MKLSQVSSGIEFKAKILSQYSCKSLQSGTPKNISIIQLEKKDADFVDSFVNFINKNISEKPTEHEKDINSNLWSNYVRADILREAILTMREICNSDCQFLNKIKMFIAVHDEEPCGMLIANMPKKTKDDYLTYSSRHNSGKKETELDWLVTWQNGLEKISGIGKSLVCEYFSTLKKDKFKDVFVRSELPENSNAETFYERIGFEKLSSKREKLANKTSNTYLIKDYGRNNDDIIPMLITKTNLESAFNRLSSELKRQEFIQKSIPAINLINIG